MRTILQRTKAELMLQKTCRITIPLLGFALLVGLWWTAVPESTPELQAALEAPRTVPRIESPPIEPVAVAPAPVVVPERAVAPAQPEPDPPRAAPVEAAEPMKLEDLWREEWRQRWNLVPSAADGPPSPLTERLNPNSLDRR